MCVRNRANGFTLLEVILALAILGVAMATLGHAVHMSHQQAERATMESDATLVAETVLAELLSGIRPLASVERELFGQASQDTQNGTAMTQAAWSQWYVSVNVQSGPLDGMVTVKIVVEPSDQFDSGLAPVEIVRWAPDPDVATEELGL